MILSAPVTGEKEKTFMKKRTVDPDFPSERAIEVPNFLPPPEELAKAKTMIIVTIGLDSETISFFKKQAEKHGTKYQKMIREVLERYAHHYKKAA